MTKNNYKWAAPGDVNAFFGLMLDNVADLLLTVSLLALVFEFPTGIALRYMVPGTAIGVLVGDLLFFVMALRLAKRTGRQDVTAMPLGLDTPSTFGMVFFVLGPAFLDAKSTMDVEAAALATWRIGICAIVASGIFKFGCAFFSNWIRRVMPRAGLLGSLAAIALVLISFLPALEVLHFPIVGFMALAIVMTSLVARIRLPFKIPGALGALLVAGSMYYLMMLADMITGSNLLHAAGPAEVNPTTGLLPYEWMSVFKFEWIASFKDSLRFMPIVIPFALGTVVGGIDCTESAAAAGDEYDTGKIIGVEALATLVAGLCGGVIQTTPYIGHPAYKAMGGRAAYTLATAIFIGSAGLLGYFGFLYLLIPKAAVFPILIFIGLEITSQSFRATPTRHYPAIVLGCIPALASLVMVFIGDLQGQYAGKVGQLDRDLTTLSQQPDNSLTSQNWSAQFSTWANSTLETLEASPASSDERSQNARQELIDSIRDYQAASADNHPAALDEVYERIGNWRSKTASSPTRDELLNEFQHLYSQHLWQRVSSDVASIEKTSGNPAKGQVGDPDGPLGTNLKILHVLSGGFILTSLLWSSALAMIVDRRLAIASLFFAIAAGMTLFGIIHSPLPGSPMFMPWELEGDSRTIMLEFAVGYLCVAGFLILFGAWIHRTGDSVTIDDDDAFDATSNI